MNMAPKMNLAIVGYGKMGRLVEHLAPEFGFAVPLRLDIDDNAGGAGITAERFRGIDVAVEFSVPAAVVGNIERLAAIGVPVVVGTTGWLAEAARARAAAEKGGIGVVWSPNFSIGVNVFLHLVAEASRRLAPYPEYGAWAWEIHHSTKKDAPSGTLLKMVEEMKKADPQRAVGRQLKPRRSASGNARSRVRFGRRHHHAAPHRAQPRGLRARRLAGGALGDREKGLVRVSRNHV